MCFRKTSLPLKQPPKTTLSSQYFVSENSISKWALIERKKAHLLVKEVTNFSLDVELLC